MNPDCQSSSFFMHDMDEELVSLKLAIRSASSPAKISDPAALLPFPPPPPPPPPPPQHQQQQQSLLLPPSLVSWFTYPAPASSPSFLFHKFFSPANSLPLQPPPSSSPDPHPSSHLASTDSVNSHPSTHSSPRSSSSYPSSTSRRYVARKKRPSRSPKRFMRSNRQGKSETIPAPFPWATTQRAGVRSISDLLSSGIKTIRGDVQCKRCEKQYQIEYDLEEKFNEVDTYLSIHMEDMHDRAPSHWMIPTLPNCRFCGQSNCVKPVMGKKRSINWIFLFLGQMLGCCKLSELKYFCKHTKCHRTGAQDRDLYLTYVDLCTQAT